MYSATHESVTVACGQREKNTDRVKNQSDQRIRYRALYCVYMLKKSKTWLLVDMDFLCSCSPHLTRSLRSLVSYRVKHSKRNFIYIIYKYIYIYIYIYIYTRAPIYYSPFKESFNLKINESYLSFGIKLLKYDEWSCHRV